MAEEEWEKFEMIVPLGMRANVLFPEAVGDAKADAEQDRQEAEAPRNL